MKKLLFILFTLAICVACKKDPIQPQVQTQFINGIFCLNEGLFQQNNASLSYYDLDSSKIKHQQFSGVNGRGLGDTANDMIYFEYKGQAYYAIAVDISSQIEIITAENLESIAQLGLFENNVPQSPRALKFHNGFLYSINFAGTISVISIDDFTVVKTITVGPNPEYAATVNNELFCVNTGGLNFPDYDKTISVIDLTTQMVSQTFESDINCGEIISDQDQELYLISRGNYSNVLPKLLRIDPTSYAVMESFDINIVFMTYDEGFIYYYDATENGIYRFNTSTESIELNQLINCNTIDDFYGIYICPKTKDIYLVDANGYTSSSTIKCYSQQGVFRYEFITNLNTGKLIFTK